MKGYSVLMSSATDEWETPQDLFDRLNAEFSFAMDVAASRENRKCEDYFGPDHECPWYRDGLMGSWGYVAPVWCNPPYSRGLQAKFIAKAAAQRKTGCTTVMLLPARTDTKAFHTHIYAAETWQPREGIEIRLLRGRLKFGGATNSAPFPSMIVVFRPTTIEEEPTGQPRSLWEGGA